MRWTGDIVVTVAAAIESDYRLMVQELAAMHGLPLENFQAIRSDDLGLLKEFARLSESQSPCNQVQADGAHLRRHNGQYLQELHPQGQYHQCCVH